MRILLPSFLIALSLAGPAQAATRNFGITSFTKIRVEGPYRVTLATGVAPFAKAEGPPAALDRVAVEMRGDTLVIRSSQSWGGYPGSGSGPVQVSVGTHDLPGAVLTGAGTLSIDRVKGLSFALSVQGSGGAEIGAVAADQMNVSLIGTASGKLGGEAKKLTALVRGVSTLDASALATPHAKISADGSATVDARVTDTAEVNAWGPASIRLSGGPSCELKLGGSASVSGCKAGAPDY
jgi:hypothetical protein